MSRSFIHLRRALFGTSCAVVFGFGATQAVATPQQTSRWECSPAGINAQCDEMCRLLMYSGGYCNGITYECECFFP